MNHRIVRIATRRSPLAIWQAQHVAERLQALYPGLETEILRMTTSGDQVQQAPLQKFGGKGLFVKELEEALYNRSADIAVHSMKDMPAELPDGLHVPVILEREDPRDALISARGIPFDSLRMRARVGTSSLRRQCQLHARRPDLVLINLRGNVNSRIDKLDRGDFDALVLAAAGLKRLDLSARVTQFFDPSECLPAIAQGALGIECRNDDEEIEQLISPLDHGDTHLRLRAERALNARLGAGCLAPVAAYAEIDADRLFLRGLVGRTDGSRILYCERRGAAQDAEAIGQEVAEDLLAQGADAVLKQYRMHEHGGYVRHGA